MQKSNIKTFSNRRTAVSTAMLLASTFLAPEIGISTATAQGVSGGVEEIVVTARRREEKLQDVPESIAAFTAADLTTRNVLEMKDVAALTPNFSINQYGAQRARRDSQTLGTRGVVARGANAGTGVFVNGAPAGGGFAASITDLERVEVLRGPQSAYFGRATFAGAVNFVTKRPSDDWSGTVEALYGEYSTADIKASVDGPVVQDILSFRGAVRHYSANGQYRNAWDNSRSTDKRTESFSGILDFHPSEDFNATAVVLFNHNLDGLPTYAKFGGNTGDFNCAAGAAGAQRNYICGEIGKFPESRIGAAFPLTPAIRAFLYDNSSNFPNPDNIGKMSDHVGDESKSLHANFRADYTLGGGALDNAVISYLGAYNATRTQFLTNSFAEPLFTNQANPANPLVPYNPAFLIFSTGKASDMYHEARLTTDQEQPLKVLAGTSYSQNFPKFGPLRGIVPAGPSNFSATSTTTFKTLGLFGALTYDISSSFTASVEARYQTDKQIVKNIAGAVLGTAKDKSFMPRASLQFRPSSDLTLYTSWARGVNPQSLQLLGNPQVVIDSVRTQTGAGTVVQGDQLDMYEVGAKGTLLDGKAAFDAAVFYGSWTNQVIQQRIIGPNPNNVAQTTTLTVLTNLGKSSVQGIELNLSANITDNFKASGTFGMTDTKIKDYYCAACLLNITGSPSVSGKHFPQVPVSSGNIFLEYRNDLVGETQWYINSQYTFRGKIYMDETNLAWTGDRNTVDFRLGVDVNDLNVELFVLNAFDNYYYPFALRDVDQRNLGAVLNNAVYVSLPEKRQIGGRVRYKF